MDSQRYPENLSPLRAELVERYERFAELREGFLVDYGYNTARAYWGDLEHLQDWCLDQGLDVLELSGRHFADYLISMEARRYSASTIRRRQSTYVLFRRHTQATKDQGSL